MFSVYSKVINILVQVIDGFINRNPGHSSTEQDLGQENMIDASEHRFSAKTRFPTRPESPPVGATDGLITYLEDPDADLTQYYVQNNHIISEPADRDGNPISNVIGHPYGQMEQPNLMTNGQDMQDDFVDQQDYGHPQGQY